MKRILFFIPILLGTRLALAQDTVNPYIIQQYNTIELHHTDVYYKPYLPPAASCTREQLSCQSVALLDSDGLNTIWPRYQPMVHAAGESIDTPLYEWQPWGNILGQDASWQRFFQSLPKADGTPTDIIAGGNVGDSVIISKNEDVDFRASGTVKLENGFHAMPGSFFHAYQSPKFDTAVFSDEFDDTAKFRIQWHVSNGWGGNYYGEGAQVNSDTNVYLDTDYQATNGHALDIMLREDTSMWKTRLLKGSYTDSCMDILDRDTTLRRAIFSSAVVRTCPWSDSVRLDTPYTPAYAHVPYGKYEIREKIPHMKFHTNNWGIGGGNYEYDINETWHGDMSTLHLGWGHALRFGPYEGHFARSGSTVIFVSTEPDWCPSNYPTDLIIDNVDYGVQPFSGHGTDTIVGGPYLPWPESFLTASPSYNFSFYYMKNLNCTADAMPWTVKYDTADHKWDIFSAGYHVVSPGDTLRFSKWNQPTSITLTTAFRTQKTFSCHWEYNLNKFGDTDILMLDFPSGDTDSVSTMTWSDLHSGDEPFPFTMPGQAYPVAYQPFNGGDTTGGYQYHTFAMELLPNEVRFLIDSVVVERWPDRMVPPGNPYYDWAATLPRSMPNLFLAEMDVDLTGTDTMGTNSSIAYILSGDTTYNSDTYVERKYFEAHPHNPGCWDVTIDGKTYHAAHHLVDYVKVWDVPKDVFITNYPSIGR